MAELKNIIRKNPLQTITTALAVIGVAVSVANFYLLSLISPIERRVDAIEKRNEVVDPLVTRFIQLEERDNALIKDVEQIREDVKEIRADLKSHIRITP